MARTPWYPGDRTPPPGPGSKSTQAAVPDFAAPPPIERAPAATASEADLAEARELLAATGLSPQGVDFAAPGVAAALAERERRVWLRVLDIARSRGLREGEIDELAGRDEASDGGALSYILKAAREATKP